MSKWVLPMIRTSSSSSQMWLTENLDEMMKLREKCNRFRVLIIGRANAGKTTILQKICNTTENATIQDPKGRMIDKSILLPSHMRGMHDIENEMVFPGNPGFVFHDSRGIEAGGTDELEILKKFVTARSKAKSLEERIHVIWYCIPVDNDRIFTAAENALIESLVVGKAPVIAVFTKFDHRDIPAFKALSKEGMDRENAKKLAPVRAKQDFEKECLEMIYARRHPPKQHVCLRDMHLPETTCVELAERTAEALESGVLKIMFVSTQRTSLTLCMKYSIERVVVAKFIEYRRMTGVMPLLNQEDLKKLACYVLVYFPNDLDNLNEKGMATGTEYEKYGGYGIGRLAFGIAGHLDELAGPHPATNRILRLGVALAIIAEHSYTFSGQGKLLEATKAYLASPARAAVHEAVNKVVNERIKDSELAEQLVKIAGENSFVGDG